MIPTSTYKRVFTNVRLDIKFGLENPIFYKIQRMTEIYSIPLINYSVTSGIIKELYKNK